MQISMNRLTVCALVFMLAGCGDGWEAKRTDTLFPYGNQRTAGSGVAYVLAKMLPSKDITPADQIFSDALVKVQPQAGGANVISQQVGASEPAAVEKGPEQVVTEKAITSEGAAHYTNPPDQPVQSVVPNKVQPAVESPAAQESVSKPPLSWDEGAWHDKDARIQEESNKRALAALRNDLAESASSEAVFISEKEIVVPKRDVLRPEIRGQVRLDEIYNGVYGNMRTL